MQIKFGSCIFVWREAFFFCFTKTENVFDITNRILNIHRSQNTYIM